MSKPRKKIFDGLEARRRDSLIAKGDYSYERRPGGSGGVPAGGGGDRRVNGSAPKMRRKGRLKAAICFAPVNEMALVLQGEIDRAAKSCTGRRPEFKAIDCLVFWLATEIHGLSLQETEMELRSKSGWRKMRKTQKNAWPGLDKRLLLSKRPPSQWQFRRFCENYIDSRVIEELCQIVFKAALLQARHSGLLSRKHNGKTSTATQPHRTQVIAGDCTQVPALYRARPGQTRSSDGKQRRFDPDAICTGKKKQPMHHVLIGTVRDDHPGVRIIVFVGLQPKGKRDSTAFVDGILDLKHRYPDLLCDLAGLAYDMDIRHDECDRLLSEGIAPICKVPRTNRGRATSINLGKLPFKRSKVTAARLEVAVIDGTPTIAVYDSNGNQYDQPLELVKHWKKTSKRTGKTTVYSTYTVPDARHVKRRHIGLKVRVRQNSKPEDIAAGIPRTRALRMYGEGVEPLFDEYFGVREDIESTNNNYKATLVNRRAECMGKERFLFDLLSYILFWNLKALVAHQYYTGADIADWLGNHKPKTDKDT